jgi:NAD(P)-dependent dehydrogenase (short-subunit alcohol dehydrogenase family)
VLSTFAGRTAVVTGAASGIGLGLARRCHERGMNVAMLDVEPGALSASAAAVGDPSRVLPLGADVRDPDRMTAVAAEVVDRFGAVHLLCNNAGISITGPAWEMTPDDWRWALDVNVVGVANGVRAFVPGMLEGGEEGHVVNTASLAGLTPMPHAAVYSATKAAVVALSEVMAFDLRDLGARVGVSVLCPGLVNTNILLSARNRPEELADAREEIVPDEALAFFKTGDDPLEVADRVLHAVEHGDFYVLTNAAGRPDIAARMQAVVDLGDPVPPRPTAIIPDQDHRPSAG